MVSEKGNVERQYTAINIQVTGLNLSLEKKEHQEEQVRDF